MLPARPVKTSRTESGSGAMRVTTPSTPRISPPCAPIAAGLNGMNSWSMESSERPETNASAPCSSRARCSKARSNSPGTFTRSGVRARSSRVPSISRNRAVLPLPGGIITLSVALRATQMTSIQWDRNAQTDQRVPLKAGIGLVTGPGESAAFHARVIVHNGHILGQLEFHATGIAAAQIQVIIVEHGFQHRDHLFHPLGPVMAPDLAAGAVAQQFVEVVFLFQGQMRQVHVRHQLAVAKPGGAEACAQGADQLQTFAQDHG